MRVFLLLLLSSSLPLLAGDLKINDPWIRAVPPSSTATAAFMTIENTSDHPVSVLGATSPVATEVKPMITTKMDDGVMGMEFVESFVIPAGGKRTLEPGGDHLMLMKLHEVPKAGSSVKLILQTDTGEKTISLDVPVR